jgi:hypothetical protein
MMRISKAALMLEASQSPRRTIEMLILSEGSAAFAWCSRSQTRGRMPGLCLVPNNVNVLPDPVWPYLQDSCGLMSVS